MAGTRTTRPCINSTEYRVVLRDAHLLSRDELLESLVDLARAAGRAGPDARGGQVKGLDPALEEHPPATDR
jgi:hypothetical protein